MGNPIICYDDEVNNEGNDDDKDLDDKIYQTNPLSKSTTTE